MLITPDIDIDQGRLADICDRYGIAELQIFGSQARGTAGPGSDIDVLYTLRPGRCSSLNPASASALPRMGTSARCCAAMAIPTRTPCLR